jgi:acyl-CoA synthetase (AMP-forming)/AMP-acid ligase II
LRGPNLMLGYADDPEATRAAIDADGWLHTGDIGRLDADGYLTITDRLKDMYICGGFNVYPAEVEQVLARLDGVAESVVIGVPDDRLGEVGKAYVLTRPGHALDEAAVLAFCRERLAGYKIPRLVVFREELPRTPAGKPLKRILREES